MSYCTCPSKHATGERVLRCVLCGLEFDPSVYERWRERPNAQQFNEECAKARAKP